MREVGLSRRSRKKYGYAEKIEDQGAKRRDGKEYGYGEY